MSGRIFKKLNRQLREIFNLKIMIKSKNLNALLLLMFAVVILVPGGGCKKDEEPGRETSYSLKVQDVLGVTGTATFIETGNKATTIKVQLFGAPSGVHPAALYMNTIAEGGTVVIELNPVDDSGSGSTIVKTHTYDELIAYDGFIKVLKTSGEPNIILAQGDIGGNVITDKHVAYLLQKKGAFNVSGTALFEKRENGNTLVTIDLDGTIAGEVYPATINLSSVATIGGGPVTKTLSSVNGNTGKSYTTIRLLDGGLPVSYDNWLNYNGYINIYQVATNYENIISQGNIGSNVK
jgi:hypothetical protein